jgi:hypothetical protein
VRGIQGRKLARFNSFYTGGLYYELKFYQPAQKLSYSKIISMENPTCCILTTTRRLRKCVIDIKNVHEMHYYVD